MAPIMPRVPKGYPYENRMAKGGYMTIRVINGRALRPALEGLRELSDSLPEFLLFTAVLAAVVSAALARNG